MKVEIVEVTTIYPLVHVIRAGSLDLSTMSADVLCTIHIDEAEEMKRRLNA